MVVYNFKKIQVVPGSKELIDIILSKTQRKTPTVIHPQYAIHRIRSFYMRKVKFTQTSVHERLSQMITDFPRVEDIHPFYADLLNVLYDRDHYKLALGQLNTARHLIDGIGRDYVRLLKYGDSPYRCKMLKRAALGRMMAVLQKLGGSLKYLEDVRQHLARLPSIDPSTRTLILTGFPNVGKSSFMNKITRANVEVQPYAFTTKSIFVGHSDYKYLRWQVLDTPGILDHPLEDRNTIEMQSITALAHLRSCILFMIDISEHCGYSIKQQIELYKNIKSLFTGKPLVIVLTKCDLVRFEDLAEENKELIRSIVGEGVDLVSLSNITDEGVANVKQVACDKLLTYRVEMKLGKQANNQEKSESILSRIHLAMPEKRDDKKREVSIPPSVLLGSSSRRKRPISEIHDGTEQQQGDASDDDDDEILDVEGALDVDMEKKTEKQLEGENGGAGVYQPDLKKWYDLSDPEWKHDVIPEIWEGKNIADFVDPNILKRLEELEEEEQIRLENDEGEIDWLSEEYYVPPTQEKEFETIADKTRFYQLKRRVNALSDKAKLPRKFKPIPMNEIEAELKSRGMDQETLERAKESTRSMSRSASRRTRSLSREEYKMRSRTPSERRTLLEYKKTEAGKDNMSLVSQRKRTLSNARSLSASGIQNVRQQLSAVKLGNKKRKILSDQSKRGESDRVINDMMPKHLYSGKQDFKRQRR